MDTDSRELIVEQFGAFIGKHSERLRIALKGETIVERPFFGLEHLLILSGGVGLSSDAIRECAERGIQISFLSRSGQPYARLVAPVSSGPSRPGGSSSWPFWMNGEWP